VALTDIAREQCDAVLAKLKSVEEVLTDAANLVANARDDIVDVFTIDSIVRGVAASENADADSDRRIESSEKDAGESGAPDRQVDWASGNEDSNGVSGSAGDELFAIAGK